MRFNYQRNIPPVVTVYVPRIILPIKTRKEVRVHISHVDINYLPYNAGKVKVGDTFFYNQRTHQGSTIVAYPMTVEKFMLRIIGTKLN